MKSKFILFLILPFFYTACSKSPAPNSLKIINITQKDTKVILTNDTQHETDTFEDEFSVSEEKSITAPNSILYSYNTGMTSFNDGFITYALSPISKGYGYVLPEPLRIGISNAYKNIQFPVRFTNNILQGKWKNSVEEFGRFVLNSTLGLAGLLDVSTYQFHIPKHEEDFGQTLAYYGIGSGFPIVLPFLGPSNARDLVGLTVDAYASPLVNVRGLDNYKIPNNFGQSTAIVAGYLINQKSLELGQYESLKKDALELYPFLQDIYEQKRTADIAE